MPLEKWSDRVVVAHLAGDAPIADDLDAAERMVSMTPMDAVLDFGGVTYLNSTDLARLIKLRKKVAAQEAGEIGESSTHSVAARTSGSTRTGLPPRGRRPLAAADSHIPASEASGAAERTRSQAETSRDALAVGESRQSPAAQGGGGRRTHARHTA